ncbi:MAG: PorV/PorQ family protein [Fidelibacterota bacterium]
MRKLIFSIFFILILSGSPFAQTLVKNVSKVAITAASFLEIGVGSRAIGMGGAFVGVADDATALYWNPAGISRLRKVEAVLVHTEWLAQTSFDYLGVVIPLGELGSIGGSVTSLTFGREPVRTVERPQGTGEYFDAADLAVSLSYARNLTDRFSIGFNVKYIDQRIWKERATSFAMDVGTLFGSQFKDMKIGASISNFGPGMRMAGKDLLVYHDIDPYKMGNNERIFSELKTDEWPLPLNFQAGIAMDIVNYGNNRLSFSLDALHPSDNTESVNIGTEYSLGEMIFMRLGYKALFLRDSEEGITLGGGLKYKLFTGATLKFDFAYADFGRLESVQRFSLGILF